MGVLADVSPRGAILLGSKVAVDGPADRLARVITHAHSDHLLGLNYSVKRSMFIIATPTTLEIVEVLGYRIPREKRMALPYDKAVEFDLEKVTLKKARHVAGSAQVLVEGANFRVGYTGDFKLPGTEPLKDLDVLVIDATYGSPLRDRKWSEWEALANLVALVEDGLKKGPVWIYGFNGKLEEVMVELRLRGINVPFIATKKTIKLAQIASRFYGVKLDPIGYPDEKVMRDSVVFFMHLNRFNDYKRNPGIHIKLLGSELRGVVVQVSDKVYNVSYSGHASFKEVMSYIEEARPKKVIVDSYRGRDAKITAKFIEKRLGIPAEARP